MFDDQHGINRTPFISFFLGYPPLHSLDVIYISIIPEDAVAEEEAEKATDVGDEAAPLVGVVVHQLGVPLAGREWALRSKKMGMAYVTCIRVQYHHAPRR